MKGRKSSERCAYDFGMDEGLLVLLTGRKASVIVEAHLS